MWRIVDVEGQDRHLSLQHKSLLVSSRQQALGRVPLSDIQAVIVRGNGATISLNLSVALAEAGIPLVLAGGNHHPVALCLPLSANYEQAVRLTAQAEAGKVPAKKLWKQVIQAKVMAQAEALKLIGHKDAAALAKLAKLVKSGDPGNVEARAARYYWKRFFGPDFKRDRDVLGYNSALNYGYAVLRATVARSLVAVGLSPALGIHHRSRRNPYQLVDDLMEPFRPLVDLRVKQILVGLEDALTPDHKAHLAALVNCRFEGERGIAALSTITEQVCFSLAEVYLGQRKDLWLPSSFEEVKQEDMDFGE